jgi:hypothetical protein
MTDGPALETLDGEAVLQKPIAGADLARAIRGRLVAPAMSGLQDGDRLIRRLRSPELLAAYLFWRAARNGNRPPRLPDLDWGGLPNADNAITVAVEDIGDEPRFRYERVGSALTTRLGRELHGSFIPPATEDHELLGSLEGAYRRCTRTLSPSYEYANYDFGDGRPVTFERLLLPVSNDGETITHLVGIVLFSPPVAESKGLRPRDGEF